MSNYIDQGFEILVNAQAIILGETIDGIFNTSKHRDNKILGGYEPDDDFVFMARTSDLTNPKSLKGVIIQINSQNYRIVSIEYGEMSTKLYSQSQNKL